MFLTDKPKEVIKKLFLAAAIIVYIGGMPITACRKDTVSAIVVDGRTVWAENCCA